MKTVKVRKTHECARCAKEIQKGETVNFWEGRLPAYDDEGDKQVGVYYMRYWEHTYLCHLTEEERDVCENGRHKWSDEYEFDGYVDCNAVYFPTGNEFCTVCGEVRLIIYNDEDRDN